MIDLSIQQELVIGPKAMQQIEFVGKLKDYHDIKSTVAESNFFSLIFRKN